MNHLALVAALALLVGCGAPSAPRKSAPSPDEPKATPLPKGFVAFPAEDKGSVRCGTFTVTWANPEEPDPEGTDPPSVLTVEDGKGSTIHKVSLTEPFERVIPEWCGDLVGDGAMVLGYDTFSGGAHCCVTFNALALAPKRSLLDAYMGNSGAPSPRRLDESPAYELVGYSDLLAYFDDLPYAASPFIPLAFAFDGERYVDATRRFPELVREDLRRALDELEPGDAEKTYALHALADYVLLGEFDTGLAALRKRVSSQTRDWLDRYAAEVRSEVEGGPAAEAPESPAPS